MANLLQFPGGAHQSSGAGVLEYASPHTNTLDLSDEEARRAALDIQRSWIVEAPAGSGKTGLLIQRLLKLLAFAEIDRPSEILAITFTRKAAAELRSRVLEQLSEAAAGKPLRSGSGEFERITRSFAEQVLVRDRVNGWRLLHSPHGLNIRTIDSFCSNLAGSLPLLSNGIASRPLIDDASILYELAAERAFRELGGPDPALHEALRTVLLHRDAQIPDVVRLLADMLEQREQWGELVPLDEPSLTEEHLDGLVRGRLERTLERVICQGLAQAAARLGPKLLAELAGFAARLSTQSGYKGQLSPLHGCGGVSHAPGAEVPEHGRWCALLGLLLTKDGSWRGKTFAINHMGFEVPKADKPWLQDLIAHLQAEDDRRPGLREILCAVRTLPPAQYPDDQWRMVKALFRVLRRALAELNALFAERGACDFTEVSLTARRLLSSDPDLLASPGAQLSHLLVDEMQDTSAGQYELLELLTRSWDGGTQTLFLVGDPKQSIYLFRQARVARFLRTQSAGRLGDVPLSALRLTANFRSQACLVHHFNATFEQILPPPETFRSEDAQEREVPFVAATPRRPPGVQGALHWHARLLAQNPRPAIAQGGEENEVQEQDGDHAAAEAAELRGVIEDFRERWIADGHADHPRIAVLARSRAHFVPILAEFHTHRERGPLAFRAVDIELLNERPEVLDLLALTRILLHPGDRGAALAVLRSPVCGLTLADLLQLTGEGPGTDPYATVGCLVDTRASLLSNEGRRLLAQTWPVLQTAQNSLGSTAFATVVERTWRSLGADAVLRADQRTNARRFLRLLHELEAGAEPLTLGLLERRLKKLYAESSPVPGAVELMTIHKAKGLEWDLVLVPGLERGTGNNRHGALRWLELDETKNEAAEVILAPIQGKGEASSSLSQWLARMEAAREIAEAKRLFYVACTRAREELHLFTAFSRKQDGELAKPSGTSLLAASWGAAKAALEAQLGSTGVSASDRMQHAEPSLPRLVPRLSEPLALAAAAESPLFEEDHGRPVQQSPVLRRLPAHYFPIQRFREVSFRLPYPDSQQLRNRAPFRRPEGSYAARAFGNVTHRFLDLATQQLALGKTPEILLSELPSWLGRLTTVFRAEGLAPALSAREAERSLQALQITLADRTGCWVLGPHPMARSEVSLQVNDPAVPNALGRNFRADRVFLAGSEPLSTDGSSHLWIVDFKTAEPGGRDAQVFFTEEKAKYQPQLESYARASQALRPGAQPVVLALFYPLVPHLVYWPHQPSNASK